MIDKNGLCPCCNTKVAFISDGVECDKFQNWYHLKCRKMSDDIYASITESVFVKTAAGLRTSRRIQAKSSSGM